ncbi:VOC family protein [Dietzia timorensis]|uniref:Biphenyl-2,3-diol 1,2-dioxygenase n=1 Tax=Dietzia timorensis TaxID=499555 RepID=A0A173LPM0_9ACTN|nr:VOC family protein [Dietzia timorensis]ANI93598.1 Biphenyl-2,3-diol 1,2-dioxygenase [Dietzia timorensis]
MSIDAETTQEHPAPDADLFGAVKLGYLVVDTMKFADWRRFGADAIGLHVDELTRDTMRFRLDERTCRVLVRRGTREDVVAVGWQADDHHTLDTILARVRAAGLPVTEPSAEECALRGVDRLYRFPGPNGLASEVFVRAAETTEPLRMLQQGFVTGDGGMGHIALTARHPERTRAYYDAIFNARLSDWIHENISGLMMRIRFLRVNERHHSIAIAGLQRLRINPIPTAVQHFNTQVESLDDMLAAYERVIAHGFKMQWSVGQHTNDRELSFYAITPSGFEWELGWDPIVFTPELEKTWAPRTYDSISIWGHTQVGGVIAQRLVQAGFGAKSLLVDDEALVFGEGGKSR